MKLFCSIVLLHFLLLKSVDCFLPPSMLLHKGLCSPSRCWTSKPRKSFKAPTLSQSKMMFWGFLPHQQPEQAPPILEISTEEELEILLNRGSMLGKLVVVDWYASWCRACFFLEPKFSRLARSLVDSCIFVKADGLLVEYNEGKCGPANLKRLAGVKNYPTFQIFKQRVLVAELGGKVDSTLFEKLLTAKIEKAITDTADPPDPLRIIGLGATRLQYQAARKEQKQGGEEGDGGDSGWSSGGGASRIV